MKEKFAKPIGKFDFLPHLDYEVEWWYFTGLLNEKFGFEFVLFLSKPRFMPLGGNFYLIRTGLIHFALSDTENKRFSFSEWTKWIDFSREGVENNLLKIKGKNAGLEIYENEYLVTADGDEYELLIYGKNEKPVILHGENGIIEMPSGKSYYYSAPRCKASGFLRIGNKFLPVNGTFWHDHQWGDFQIKCGWDWFSIRLDDGTDIMAFVIKDRAGNISKKYISVSYKNGDTERFEDFEIKSKESNNYPKEWEISFEKGSFTIKSLLDGQVVRSRIPFVPEYAEMLSSVSGTLNGKQVNGYAYVEITNGGRKRKR